MPILFKPAFLSGLMLNADKENIRAVAVTLITGLIVVAGFRFAREVIAALLMKLYNVFIQKNAAGL